MQVALLAIFAIFASCNKDENDTTIPVNNKKNISPDLEIVKGFTYSDILTLTSLHNEFCEEFSQIFDLGNGTIAQEMERCFTEAPLDGISKSEREKIINCFRERDFAPFSSEELTKWILENQNIKDKENVLKIIFSISEEELDSSTYVSFSSIVDSLQTDAYNKLSGYDLLAVITFLEQAKASYYFWMPNEIGGSGTGYSQIVSSFMQNSKGNTTHQPSKWWKAAASATLSDAKAATVASYVVAFSGGTGLGAAAAGVAGSSLLDGIITLLSE